MSAQPLTYEGTWEDTLRHSTEFAGHKVRLTIVDEIDEQALLSEYHALVDGDLNGTLSPEQRTRLNEIEVQLDHIESQNSHVRALEQNVEEGNRKLDAILAVLNTALQRK